MSFIVIIIVPLTAAAVIFLVFNHIQMNELENLYKIRGNTGYYLAGSIQMLNQLTVNEEDEYSALAVENPEALVDFEFLESENSKLKQKNCFLLMKDDNSLVYKGTPEDKMTPKDLTLYDDVFDQGYVGMFMDLSTKALVKQINFIADGKQYSLFVVASADSITPQLGSMLFDLVMTVLLILFCTALLFFVLIYQSIIIIIIFSKILNYIFIWYLPVKKIQPF